MKQIKLTIPEGVNIRDYQMIAYENWLSRNCSGIFAMATGTGKTITSFYCAYSEHAKVVNEGGANSYHLVILVPTQPLLDQWAEQAISWGFKNILLASGKYNWKLSLQELTNDFEFGLDSDFLIVATYRSLTSPDFLQALNKLPADTILIADEAHTLGQRQIKTILPQLTGLKKRIGLSATPNRQYDPDGTQEMEVFFRDSAPYTYSLFMDKAIDSGFLCKYDYYPILVPLNDPEMKEYISLSKRIAIIASKDRASEDNSKIEFLLLKRKRIINKATNKLTALKNIIKDIKLKEELTFCFTYAPAGEVVNDTDEINLDNKRMIREMQQIFELESPNIRTHAYLGETENRKQVLNSFENGEIDVLLAINCLDEGIDVPRTSIGIFTSSTGNPRQFIQRRGRLLRNHKDKTRALIYDMVVIPCIFGNDENTDFFTIERNMVRSELMRVGYFAKLSENFYDAQDTLETVCDYYKLDLTTIIKELE